MKIMSLKADDGTILSIKEAIVIDKDGVPIGGVKNHHSDQKNSSNNFWKNKSNGFTTKKWGSFQVSGLLFPLFLVGAALVMALGTFFIGGFIAIIFGIGVVRWLARLIAGKSGRVGLYK